MKKLLWLVTLLGSLGLLMPASVQAYSSTPYFPDVPVSHWAFEYVQQLYEYDISQGYQDGTFGPTNQVSRAEMSKFTIKSMQAAMPIFEIGDSGDTVEIAGSCTHYTGAVVTITVPGPGQIVVTGNVWIRLSHTTGTDDIFYGLIGTTESDCDFHIGQVFHEINSAMPTGLNIDSQHIARRTFQVTAGTHTYYVNGYMNSDSGGTDDFWYATIDALFIPDLVNPLPE